MLSARIRIQPRRLASRTRIRRRAVAATAAGVLVGSLLLAPTAAALASPAAGATVAAAPSPAVTLAGSLQTEAGCAADWDPACAATDLTATADGAYTGSLSLPAGNYEFKVAIGHSWDENYGLGGAANGANIPLVLSAEATVAFRYDPQTHLVTLSSESTPSSTVTSADRQLAGSSLRDNLTKERFYFVMTDRFANADKANDAGGLTGDRLTTGLDPTDKGFYHGGDLKGITGKLDYIKGLGTTSIWLTPSFKNQPVQGSGADVSAGYHGYWITDFTQIDPHLGSNADLKTLIDKAHAKGMKVFFDIITNHTADVIDYRQGPANSYKYIDKASTPYVDANGVAFDDHAYAAGSTFPTLNTSSFPYTPYFRSEADKTVKVPAWLNDPLYYHNRGNAAFDGTEGDRYGDFSGLDDLFTEQPVVRDGLIDIYAYWAKFGIDGFRIDTVKHVNVEFWQKFIPAMQQAAATVGKKKFFQFGEVYDADPANMSYWTTAGTLPATLDFGFQARATGFGLGQPTGDLAKLYAADDYYTDPDSNAYSSPTFLGNHDMGRIGYFLSSGGHSGADLLQRDELTQELMFLTRGQPVTYYGDEQGFVGDGGDKDARQDMFASKVASYNDDTLIGSSSSTAVDNYNTGQPLYRKIAELSKLRANNPALADGAQIPRYSSNAAGVFAVSRIDANQQVEYLVASNNATEPKTVSFDTFNANTRYRGIYGGAQSATTAKDGRITVTVPALSSLVWKADTRLKHSKAAPQPVFVSPGGLGSEGTVGGRAPISVAVPGGGFNQVTFAWRAAGTGSWHTLGTDDNPPYRVYQDVAAMPKGSLLEYRALVRDNSGNMSAVSTSAVVGDPAASSTGGGTAQNDPPATQPTSVTIAGDLDSEIGCGGDWDPACAAAHLTLDTNDGIWKGTFTLPAGGAFQYKAAIDDSWTENYGANAKRDGGNIAISVPASGSVTFYYDPSTHWVTSSAEGPIVTAPGSAQSELGCSADWAPDCMRPWLQDPDGDGTYTFSTAKIPAGSYEVKAAHGLSWDESYGAGGDPNGANIAYTVTDGAVVTFSYVLATHVLTVTSSASTAADLGQSKAQALSTSVIAWDLPAAANTYHYRLHYAATGGLGIDATAVTGGSSVALTRDPAGLSAALKAQHPNLSGYDALRLPDYVSRDKRLLEQITSGQVVVAAYDDAGTLIDATGVQLPWLLDALYPKAAKAELGPTWNGNNPELALWAPTAKSVELLLTPAGSTAQQTIPMRRDSDGVWSVRGRSSWQDARYLFAVTVYVPETDSVQRNVVTDPYSVALTTNSAQSVVADLSARSLQPAGWDRLRKPDLPQPSDTSVYELQVRDFSISDTTVPAAERGTFLAFTHPDSAGMQHLKALSQAGLNTLHLLPVFDIATINEDRSQQQTPQCDLPALTAADPAGEAQQACTSAVADTDGFNWGYDPWHYTTPEGSYATNPDGTARTLQMRQMVSAVNGIGLRVVMDVVYNHTTASGQDPKSVLDKVVPGYYHRLSATGALETSTCCANTATEHAMMNKLTVDSIVTWAKQYKIDGFRFDLMGHMPKQTILDVRHALDRLTLHRDGVDGRKIYLYGEGWNFGEVADDALFVQATQQNMAGTGVGTFNDRLRDSVRGGGPFDDNPGKQGFGTGLFTDPNSSDANGSADEQKATLLADQDRIKVGLVGNLANYQLVNAQGETVRGKDIDYNGAPTGYTAEPSETINYVDAHDNETLFDVLAYKLPADTPMADRVRMNTLSLATVALGQGPMFWHAGTDLLRSKSLDRDSYNSGDWFNRIDWTGQQSTFGSGLPPKAANEAKWPYMRPLLADAALVPQPADIAAATAGAQDLLKLRYSSPLFRLGDAATIGQKVSFLTSGPDQAPGVIAMQIDDRVGRDIDRSLQRIVVVFNASPDAQTVTVAGASALRLSPIQAAGADPVVKSSSVATDSVTVPGRTVAVFVQPRTA
ncbi:pullulanase-type alpha-1,6-glucosidase [Nakamurella lactea]|uniref:pullulanase-type alpha-1,6-glucosidase n=1 Tax=Nakamurella lactea TaxID=459515 RepID=UPI00040541CB|nr:pullulanase-type alpha-1,6-glucosidase [Nakamurella lactea]